MTAENVATRRGEGFALQRLPTDGGTPKDDIDLAIETVNNKRRAKIQDYMQGHQGSFWLQDVAQAAGTVIGARGVSQAIRSSASEHGVDTSFMRISLKPDLFESIAFTYLQTRYVDLDDVAARLRTNLKQHYTATDIVLIALGRPRADAQLIRKLKSMAIDLGAENTHHGLKITPEMAILLCSEIEPYKAGKGEVRSREGREKRIGYAAFAELTPNNSITEILRAIDASPSDLYLRQAARNYLEERGVSGRKMDISNKLFVDTCGYVNRLKEAREQQKPNLTRSPHHR